MPTTRRSQLPELLTFIRKIMWFFVLFIGLFPVLFYVMQYELESSAKLNNLITSLSNDICFAGISIAVVTIVQSVIIISDLDKIEGLELLGKSILFLITTIISLMLLIALYDKISVSILSGNDCKSSLSVISCYLFIICLISCFKMAHSAEFRGG